MADYTKKAFIADDEADLRTIMKTMLERESYLVTQCRSYDDAHKLLIEKGKAKGLDLVILDGKMPPMPKGKHGADLAKEVKLFNPSLYVVLFTSDPLQQFRHLLPIGIKLYQKPDLFELVNGIKRDLGGKK